MTIETRTDEQPAASAPQPSRTAVWLPWVVVSALAAIVALTFVLTDNSATAPHPPYPSHHLDDPYVPWLFAYVFPVIWFGLLVTIVVWTARQKSFAMPALLFLAGTTMFWIEWFADWGSYLVWNRDFPLFEAWTSTWYQTHLKPISVVFGYGIFFGVEALVLLKVVPRISSALQRVLPKVSPTVLLIASCMMLFYAIDMIGERLMTAAGWYSYVDAVGPFWESSRGTISFVWPAIPFLFFAVIVSLCLRVDENGNYPNERLFRVHALAPGWGREFARLAVWIVTMNVAIFIAQPLFLIIGRLLFFHDSVYVP
ncbi:hypothetical protein [Mycolicibacterium sp. XJ1819]